MEISRDDQIIGTWLNSITFSKEIIKYHHDFSDGVLMAELIKFHVPQLVDVHSYIPTSNKNQKRINWNRLNEKVFSKIGFELTENEIENIISAKAEVVKETLKMVYVALRRFNNLGAKIKKADNITFEKRINNKTNSNSTFKKYKASDLLGSHEYIEEKYKIIINEKDKIIEEMRKRIKELEMELRFVKEGKK